MIALEKTNGGEEHTSETFLVFAAAEAAAALRQGRLDDVDDDRFKSTSSTDGVGVGMLLK